YSSPGFCPGRSIFSAPWFAESRRKNLHRLVGCPFIWTLDRCGKFLFFAKVCACCPPLSPAATPAFPKEELSCCVKGHPLGGLRAGCLELGLSASTTRSMTAEKPANTKT